MKSSTMYNSKHTYFGSLDKCLYHTWKARSAKIIPQKNAENLNKFIKNFVEINKNEVNKNSRQKQKKTFSR